MSETVKIRLADLARARARSQAGCLIFLFRPQSRHFSTALVRLCARARAPVHAAKLTTTENTLWLLLVYFSGFFARSLFRFRSRENPTVARTNSRRDRLASCLTLTLPRRFRCFFSFSIPSEPIPVSSKVESVIYGRALAWRDSRSVCITESDLHL